MKPDTLHFSDYQAAFAARIRDPKRAPRPAGASAKRMRVYEEMLFNNLEGFLARRQLPWPVGDNYPGRWKRGMVGLAFGAGFGLGVVVQHSRGAPRLC